MEKLPNLFKEGAIGNLVLKNRIVLSPLLIGYGKDFYVTDDYVSFLEDIAKGGTGLLITGATRVVSETGILGGSLGAFDDKFIPGLKRIVQAVKGHDAKIFLQINHAGTRASERNPNATPVAPSAIPHPLTGVVPKELSLEEIESLTQSFVDAARRGREAGFDGVEVHGAHGYLINQFLSQRTNRREDEFGGSPVARAKFPCEIIRRIKKEVGQEFPLSFRICGDEYVEGGVRINDAIGHAQLFVDAGVDALHVSAGSGEAPHRTIPTFLQENGCLVPLADRITRSVTVPVIAVGKLGDPIIADRVLGEGKADFIAWGRPLLADHELPNKAKDGRYADIRRCIYCNLGCSQIRLNGKVTCTVNPRLGLEPSFQEKPAEIQKKIIVVGAGLAGLEAATVLASRGHNVSVHEKTNRVGGQWNLLANCREEVGTLVDYLYRGAQKAGVEVLLNSEIDIQYLRNAKPDAVVIATGAEQKMPHITGIDGKNVVLAWDVLRGAVQVGQDIIVIGGGLVGCETAYLLAKLGKCVSIVDIARIPNNASRTFKLGFLEKFVEHRVSLYPNCRVAAIAGTGVNIVIDDELLFLRSDTVVVAAGSKENNRLAKYLEAEQIVPEVRTVGDCVEPRNAWAAIREGFQIGNEM